MATFVVLKHPITVLVTDFTNPDNLTNDLLILKYLLFSSFFLHKLMVDTLALLCTIITSFSTFSHLKHHKSIKKVLLVIFDQKDNRHLHAGLPVFRCKDSLHNISCSGVALLSITCRVSNDVY